MTFLGIDAGGTKALFALCNEQGQVLKTLSLPGMTPTMMTQSDLEKAFYEGTHQILEATGLSFEDLSAVAIGLPCLGESVAGDARADAATKTVFSGIPFELVNDSHVAWAGSLKMQPGVNVVCGTGTISFGVDRFGNSARCGGWTHHFSDEGSGYWLGKKLLELFCKQSDGRIPHRGPLYAIVRERFGIINDFEIIDIMEDSYLPHRDKVAGLQRILFEAAEAGDQSAIDCYRQAGYEAALCIRGVISKLDFNGTVPVSYSGGIFKAGELMLRPFRESLNGLSCTLNTPVAPPYIGSLMMAQRLAGAETAQTLSKLVEEGTRICT